MIAALVTRLFALVAGLSLLASAGCAAPAQTVRSAAALPAGAALVAIAPDSPPRADLESEAYADWAAYLDDYVAAKPATLGFARVSAARWMALARSPAMPGYATVFLRPDGQALVYRGMVLDLAVYQAGAAWALGGPLPDLARMQLASARVANRR